MGIVKVLLSISHLFFCIVSNLHAFLSPAEFFQNLLFLKNSFRLSNSFDPDQAWHFVWPDLGLICLQRLSADDTSRQTMRM